MPKNKSDWLLWGTRTLLIAGVSFLVWARQSMVTKEEFNQAKYQEGILIDTKFEAIKSDVADIKFSIRRIEDRLDRKGIGNSFIPGFPMYNFRTTNMGGVSVYGRR